MKNSFSFLPHSLQKIAAGALAIGLVAVSCFRYFSAEAAIPAGYVEFYIPGETQQVWDMFEDMDNDPDLVEANGLHTVIGVASPLDSSTVYYDHWEDGYDFDENNPDATADIKVVLSKGGVQEWESSNIPVDPRGTTTHFDGRDKIFVAGGPVTVTVANWPESIGTVFSFAVEVLPTGALSNSYTLPIGEDLAGAPENYADFTKTYLLVQALEDATTVTIDDPTIGGVEVNTVLNRGEVTQLFHANAATTINGSNNVQVQFFIGNAHSGQSSQMRGLTLSPISQWSNAYYAPVGSFGSNESDIYLYNPNGSTITVDFEDKTGTGSFTIPAGATKSYEDGAGRFVPDNSGALLSSTSTFWGISTVDTESATYDWAYSLVPQNALSEDYILGWAPGSSEAVPTVNGSPVFITAINDDTDIFIDYSPADGTIDQTYNLNRLDSQKVFDPDFDNTGMSISSTSPIAVAWGEDPSTASSGSPYLDMGYTTLPILPTWIDVVLEIDKTANPTTVSVTPGQTSTFTIVTDTENFPVNDVDVVDILPPGWNYVNNSTTITLPNLSQITGAAANPSIASQTLTWDLDQDMSMNQTLTIEFQGITTAGVSTGYNRNDAVASGTRLSGAQVFSPIDKAFVYIPTLSIDLDTSTPNTVAGSTADYTLRLLNDGNGAVTNASASITLPTGFTFASQSITETNATRTSSSDPTVGDNILNWSTWDISNGGSVVIDFTVNIGGGVGVGTYDTTASGTSTETGAIDDAGTVGGDPDTPPGEDPEDDEDVTIVLNNGSIGDFVWFDTNGDGVQDGGESGANNVTVALYQDNAVVGVFDGSDTLITSQTTNATGAYDFTLLPAGNYVVDVTDTNNVLTGYSQTGGSDPTFVTGLTNTQDFNTADFGFQPPQDASIGDFIWDDLNGDGVQDGGEPGIGNVTVDLIQDTNGNGAIDGGEPVLSTQTTNGSGAYDFTNLGPGNYIVDVTDTNNALTGFVQTGGSDPVAVTPLAISEDKNDVDFGFQDQSASIGDFVWNDLDGDGVQDGGEPGIGNVTVDLIQDTNGNGAIDGGEPVLQTQTTNGSGAFDFTNLPAGNYIVDVTDTNNVLTGFVLTGGTDPLAINLPAGQDKDDADFGYQQQDASIGDFVWDDKDGDGVQDAGEPGIVNITIDLISDTNGNGAIDGGEPVLSTETTTLTGAYDFANLPAGNYIVNVTDTNNVLTVFTLTGGTDPLAVTGLTAGQDFNTADFGYQAPQDASIGDTIWMDFDGDGVIDTGEPGIQNVTVDLIRDTNGDGNIDGGEPVVGTQTTNAGGNYDFIGLGPDNYIVNVTDTNTVLTGFTLTGGTHPLAVTPLAISEDKNDADFGYQPPATASIGDFIWDDLNGDGVQDGGEPGIQNVTVDLHWDVNQDGNIDGGDVLIGTQTTNGAGAYDFTNQMPRDYIVDVTDTNNALTGFVLTGGTDPLLVAGLAIGQDLNTADFGYQDQSASIGDFIWDDLNGDGVQDGGEPGLNNVTVDLYRDNNNDQLIDGGDTNLGTQTTVAGAYDFTNLTAGNYIVDVTDTNTVLTGYVVTGGSDPFPVPGLTAGQDKNDADIGYQKQDGSISGKTWKDVGNNKTLDPTDPGIFNVTVDLFNDINEDGILDIGDTIRATQQTDINGDYSFTNLPVGKYLVKVNDVNPPLTGLLFQDDNPLAVNLLASQAVTDINFRYFTTGGGAKRFKKRPPTTPPPKPPEPPQPPEEPEEPEEPEPPLPPEEPEEPEVFYEELAKSAPSDCDTIHPGVKENMSLIFEGEGCNVRDKDICTDDPVMSLELNQSSCLELDPDRPIVFGDLDPDDDATPFIQTLKNTRIINEGDYVFSGDGNHSTGKEQDKYKSGTWEFQPDRLMRRIEVVKTALIANCIPVEETIPVPRDGFRFLDLPVDIDPSDEIMYFTARVFYTGYKYGVINGYNDLQARPFEYAKNAEIAAILLRAAHAIPADYDMVTGAWYQRYMHFAHNNGIFNNVQAIPNEYMDRKDFAKVLIRVMAYNPNSSIHGYIERVNIAKQEYYDYETNRPIPALKNFDIVPLKCVEEEVASCHEHIPDRPLKFTDMSSKHFASPYTEILRTTKIGSDGDFIVSGHGNPSTGRQQEEYRKGRWEYQPERSATRLELLKTALVSNCITVEDEIPVPEDGFRFRDVSVRTSPTNEAKHFIARVVYTAYKHGLITGGKERKARPLDPINRVEAVVLLTRASRLIDDNFKPMSLPFTDIFDDRWYSREVSYAYEHGLVGGFGDGTFKGDRLLKRSEMAKLLITFMATNKQKGIRQFMNKVIQYYKLHEKTDVVYPDRTDPEYSQLRENYLKAKEKRDQQMQERRSDEQASFSSWLNYIIGSILGAE